MTLIRPITHIDCFAEPGGICTGLATARFKTLVAIEYVKSCCDTYRANHPKVHCIHSDIRDIVPSREAMASNFWSIGFVLDGTMFEVPKYKNMVNGNQESEIKKNGWHGMYVLSFKDNINRIYGVDWDFKIIREHTIKAFNCWHKDRMGLVQEWRADN